MLALIPVEKPASLSTRELSDAQRRRAVRLTDHGLLLADQHEPDNWPVQDAAGRRKAEQGTLAESRREFGLLAGRVAEEQHVRAVGHGDQDG